MTRNPETHVGIFQAAGAFAEDKDRAASLREKEIRPSLKAGQRVVFDFKGVTLATQSFIHALISDVLRHEGEESLKRMQFKDCNKSVRGIVETVVEYSLESIEPDEKPASPKAKSK